MLMKPVDFAANRVRCASSTLYPPDPKRLRVVLSRHDCGRMPLPQNDSSLCANMYEGSSLKRTGLANKRGDAEENPAEQQCNAAGTLKQPQVHVLQEGF